MVIAKTDQIWYDNDGVNCEPIRARISDSLGGEIMTNYKKPALNFVVYLEDHCKVEELNNDFPRSYLNGRNSSQWKHKPFEN
jgi:hypothetical protein